MSRRDPRTAQQRGIAAAQHACPASLGRTVDLGELRLVARQMGHSTPHLTMTIYAQVMERRDGERERLKALVNGERMASLETRAAGRALTV